MGGIQALPDQPHRIFIEAEPDQIPGLVPPKEPVEDGIRLLVGEAQLAGWQPDLVIHTPDLDSRGLGLVSHFQEAGVQVEQVTGEVMQAASDTENPQGLLAVLPLRRQPQPGKLDFVVIADQIRDPGNLGTLLRTALAAGADAVFMPPGTVDPFSPKVVRAGMGAHFRLPLAKTSWDDIKVRLKDLTIYTAEADHGIDYTTADLTRPIALIIGSEISGPGETSQKLADQTLRIPMPGPAESLNAAVAGAVLIFEAVRQRRTARDG
jgi:TrmH family RNA methyltransferase